MLKKGVNQRHSEQNHKNINIDLQLNLLNTWTKFNVADYYQNIFLVHLDELSPHQAEQLIKKQITLTLQRKSLYFQLEKLDKDRKVVIENLQNMLAEVQHTQSEQKLSEICEQIKQLREINLIFAEHILKMYNLYHCTSAESSDKQMEYYDAMLNDLDQDNQFMKDSILNKYLRFDEGYDPFLMNQYQTIHRSKSLSIHPAIKELFNLNISYAYRLMKTKNMILQLRAVVNHFEAKNMPEIPFTDRLKQNQSSYSRRKIQSKGNLQRLKTQFDNTSRNYSAFRGQPVKIQPIHIYPSTHAKSRTTIYKEKDARPDSTSNTEGNSKLRLKFTKMVPQPPSSAQLSYIDIRNRNERPKYFNPTIERIQPSKSLDLHRRLQPLQKAIYNSKRKYVPFEAQAEQLQRSKPYKYKAAVGQIYRSIKLAPLRTKVQNEDSYRKPKYHQNRIKTQHERNSQRVKRFDKSEHLQRKFEIPLGEQGNLQTDYNPIRKQVKNYNPIKKQEYQTYETQPKKSKYDYAPNKLEKDRHKQQNQNIALQASSSEESDTGLLYQRPISKYNLKRKNKSKKNNSENTFSLQKPLKTGSRNRQRVDKQCQTIQLRNPNQQPKPQTIPKKIQPQKKQTDSDESQQEVKRVPQKKKKVPSNSDSDQTLEDEDIVDQRPIKKPKKEPLIRTLNKENPKLPQKNNQKVTPKATPAPTTNSNNAKKQIRMKVGKANVAQVIQLLKQSKIKDEYLNSFDLQKTIAWIKVSQTYLTQFTVNDQPAIIALCSPIPNIGTALKFWATVTQQIDLNAAANLFKKYLEFVEKSTTSEKILFSGKPFKELQLGQFVMKKENLYQKVRKTPARQSNQQFKPFLYVQCSNLTFQSKGNGKVLYSEQIQQFTSQNCFAISFIAQTNDKNVPNSIRPLVKFSSNLQNFKKVNSILTDEGFDNYEISQIQTSKIDLMRLYLNSPLKTTFIAQDNCFKFNGTLLHQKDKECIVSVALTKNNGNLYFAKNIKFPQFLEMIKKTSPSRVNFTVMMFSKKLYGKMPEVEGGCYGNWQLNLTWEDQMQGRIRHNMKENVAFGSQNFKVLLELEKIVVLGFQVNKQDLI